MKRVVVFLQGASEGGEDVSEPRTPLASCMAPNLQALAQLGRCGCLVPIRPAEEPWRSEVELGLISGATVQQAIQLRRGPMEAVGAGVDLQDAAFVYRANFVTMDGSVLQDSRVDSLGWKETQSLVDALQLEWGEPGLQVVATEPSQAVVILADPATDQFSGIPPRLLEGASEDELFPAGNVGRTLHRWFNRTREILESHEINEVRVDLGENPANGLYLSGGSAPIQPRSFADRLKGRGVVLTHGAMGRGLARLSGSTVVEMRSPWAGSDVDSVLHVADTEEAIRSHDHVLIVVEAPYDLGGYGDLSEKTAALGRLDRVLLGPLREFLDVHRPWRGLLLADPEVRSPFDLEQPVALPALLVGERIVPDSQEGWHEQACQKGGLNSIKSELLIEMFWED